MAVHWGGRGPGHSGRNSAPSVAAATWNPADKSTVIGLAYNDLTGVSKPPGGTFESARATVSGLATDALYFEAAYNGGNAANCGVGLYATTAALTGFAASGTDAAIYFAVGTLWHNGSSDTLTAYNDAAIIGIAVKKVGGVNTMWVRLNGTWANGDPVAGTGGRTVAGLGSSFYPAFCDGTGSGGFTLNAGRKPFANTIPSGFTAWKTSAVASNAATFGYTADGDSLTEGTGETRSYPVRMAAMSALSVTNTGTGGQTLTSMDTSYAADVAPTYNASTKNTLVLLGGINDLITSGNTAVQIQGYMTSYAAKAIATGWRFFPCTLLPATVAAGLSAGQNTERLAFNTWLLANYVSLGAKAVIDLAAIPELADPSITSVYRDGLHTTDYGATLVAAKVINVTWAAGA